MNVDKLLPMGSSVSLPTSKSPKVILAVDNAAIAHNSFQLYNPFSQKAKIFKGVVSLLFFYANPLAKWFFARENPEKTKFHRHLEQELGLSLHLSIYRATANDKVVVQLQSKDAEIMGYLKYPLNDLGLKHLDNEKKAIEILAANNIIPRYKKQGAFENNPFLILDPLKGDIALLDAKSVDQLLIQLKRDEVYLLSEHPRILQLKAALSAYGLEEYSQIIQLISNESTHHYALAYEHGDFAPWNIIQVKNKLIPFDFEFFVEDGIEFFDLIKYHYQIATLLEKKSGDELINYVREQTNIEEFSSLFQLFLIKEIIRCHEESESYETEAVLLEQLTSGKI